MVTEEVKVDIKLLNPEELPGILPLIQQLNPTIPFETLKERLAGMVQQGYQCVAAYQKGELVGAAGFWFGTRFYCGKYVDVDNVIVDQRLRSRRIGKLLMDWVETFAGRHDAKCRFWMLIQRIPKRIGFIFGTATTLPDAIFTRSWASYECRGPNAAMP